MASFELISAVQDYEKYIEKNGKYNLCYIDLTDIYTISI